LVKNCKRTVGLRIKNRDFENIILVQIIAPYWLLAKKELHIEAQFVNGASSGSWLQPIFIIIAHYLENISALIQEIL